MEECLGQFHIVPMFIVPRRAGGGKRIPRLNIQLITKTIVFYTFFTGSDRRVCAGVKGGKGSLLTPACQNFKFGFTIDK